MLRIIVSLCISIPLTMGFQLFSTRSRPLSQLNMAGGQIPMVPFYPDKASKDYQWMDIYNALGRKRTLFVGRFLDDEACNQLISSLIWLQSQNEKDPITLYFNVPGAIMKPSLAVFDVMRRMTCPLITINMGLSVGMGAVLCAVGSQGQRFAMPNSRFLMSRTGLEDGIQGQSVDLSLAVSEVMKDNKKVIGELSKLCGQPLVKLENDFKRDFYLTAAEAAAYGIIDKVMLPAQPVKIMRYRGEDDDVVTFGHFSESRKVKAGPADVVVPYKDANFDEYAAGEMKKKGMKGSDRIDPRTLRNGGGANRFANSRCKPPGQNKPVVPPKGPDDKLDEFDKNPFKNTGW
jgi:ATP-dependent Clp protease protease subunit